MELPDYLKDFIETIATALPGVLGAFAVLIVGWFISWIIKKVVYRLMLKTDWDEKLLGNTIVDTNKFVANLVYYILMVLVLLIVLEMMGVSYVLEPIRNMLNEFLGFIPNILAGLTIGFIGYIIAKFVANLAKVAGSVLDRFADKIGVKETDKLMNFIQQLLFVVVLIPFIIQALNAFELEAITRPANDVLNNLMEAVPNIIGAVLIITLFVVGGRFVTGLLRDLLHNLGTDSLAAKLRLNAMIGENQSLSKILSGISFFFIVFFGIISGIEMLGFDQLSQSLNSILLLSGNILFGLTIMVIGNFVGYLVHSSLVKGEGNNYLAGIARVGIIGLFLAIALRTMGIANSIVELAFGLTLGALAVAVALSYGLGGREAAGKHMEKILRRFQKEE